MALVDDEQNIRELVSYALQQEGYRVVAYRDGEEAWTDFRQSLPDLVILDIIMPRMDGLELCRKIRSLSETLPLIFLTSKDEEFDKVLGLELGADDYLCKPFSTRELLARVKVLFRRRTLALGGDSDGEDSILRCGSLEMDRMRHGVSHPRSLGPTARLRQNPRTAAPGGLSLRRVYERPQHRRTYQTDPQENLQP